MEEINFVIERDEDNTFFAKALGHSIFTQADTEKEIKEQILDAVACHFDNPPKLIRLHFVKELLNNFIFAKITELTKPKAQFLSELKLSIDHLNDIKKNDSECKSLEELFNEL